MSNTPVFGKKQAERALKILGFNIYDDRGKGSHGLAKHPTRKPNPGRPISNITIPHYKTYDDPDLRSDFIKEISHFGFTKDQILSALRGKKPKDLIELQVK